LGGFFATFQSEIMKKDVVIVGGGAAGLMCAIEAGKRGRSVLLLEHNEEIGEKIRISGGGRCNFTNFVVEPRNYISQNPHFCKSALSRYPSASFVTLVRKCGISYHEKKLGQLFCDGSSKQIIEMLLSECRAAGVEIQTDTKVSAVRRNELYSISTPGREIEATSLVIASGGLSIPKLGASNFGYGIAKQFGMNIIAPKPGLVPLTLRPVERDFCASLSGVSLDAAVRYRKINFRDQLLFTHRGLSGPAILQISSYWEEGESIILNLLPDQDAFEFLKRNHNSKSYLSTVLEEVLPKRFVQKWFESRGGARPLNRYSLKELRAIGKDLNAWHIVPSGTEGFEKAEVTVGGIDTDELSSKTMGSKKVPGLYFVGEVVDVTGWLGGYNFQWAWSSGWVAGQYA
jgi:predicted Rossmann fold flavoprotein